MTKRRTIIFTFLFLFSFASLLSWPVSARTGCGGDGADPYAPPPSCSGRDEFTIDSACQFERIIDKDSDCCVTICKGSGDTIENGEEYTELISFFGSVIAIRSVDQVPAIINLIISSFLGIIAAYGILRGIYVAGVVRARSTDEEKIAEANKELVTMIIAVAIAFSFLIVIQLVASLLGIGNLQDLVIFADPTDPGTTTDGTQIVIRSNKTYE